MSKSLTVKFGTTNFSTWDSSATTLAADFVFLFVIVDVVVEAMTERGRGEGEECVVGKTFFVLKVQLFNYDELMVGAGDSGTGARKLRPRATFHRHPSFSATHYHPAEDNNQAMTPLNYFSNTLISPAGQ